MGWKPSVRNATLSSKACTVPWNPSSEYNCIYEPTRGRELSKHHINDASKKFINLN